MQQEIRLNMTRLKIVGVLALLLFTLTIATALPALAVPNQTISKQVQSSASRSTLKWSDRAQAVNSLPAGLFDSLAQADVANLLNQVYAGEIVATGPTVTVNTLASALFDLVQYMRNNVDPRSPADILASVPKYKRVEMFGSWVNEDSPNNCYNTRAEVLLRDAVDPSQVQFSTSGCTVKTGDWEDPYSGTDFKSATAVQIDHVVPLKNAYRSGASSWSNERRCTYGNFLKVPYHLRAVSGHENMSKSDKGPEEYLPPDESFVCEYISEWLRIKAIWNMSFVADERDAIEKTLNEHGCDNALVQIPLREIQMARAASQQINAKCVAAP